MALKMIGKTFFSFLLIAGILCIGVYTRQITPMWAVEWIAKIGIVYIVCETITEVALIWGGKRK